MQSGLFDTELQSDLDSPVLSHFSVQYYYEPEFHGFLLPMKDFLHLIQSLPQNNHTEFHSLYSLRYPLTEKNENQYFLPKLPAVRSLLHQNRFLPFPGILPLFYEQILRHSHLTP